jgi:AcrR family transcriptional regulator
MVEPTYREKMRSMMLAIAQRILETEGLSALQARRVAREANCAVGTLYNVFEGLDELIVEANAKTLEALGKALVQARDQAADQTVLGRLLAMALAYLQFAREHDLAWRAVFEHHMASGQTVPGWYRDDQGQLFALVEQVLADSSIAEAKRASAARALFSAVHGIIALAQDQKLGRTGPEDATAHVRFAVTAITHGLAAGEPELPG